MNSTNSRFGLHLLLILSTSTQLLFAQQGDRGNEVQTPRVPRELIPPAPPLTPEEALKSFKIQDGFKIEIAASEPLIESPIAVQFDPEGRMWVLELRGYMPNEKGEGETEPVGRISVLEDTDGDGRMDRRKVFLEHLVMPRAIMLLRGGLLVAEPPLLWFYRDANGDGVADQKSLVADNYATEANPLLGNRANQEHSANSLVWSIDNWIYSANYSTRFRNVAGYWERGSTTSRGQWGLTQDNIGRLFHNGNSDQLRGDLVPAEYLSRNPNYTGMQGANYRVAVSQEVWPGRVNPGVNRGYQVGQLRPDGTLATFTGACGPVIYRGDNFPLAFQGNAFVCEPTGNVVRRNILTEADGVVTANNAYNQTEFLTSTDERFRPVNLFNGPDGALYIVDIYRGLLQHRVYVTTYLLNQTLDRNLQAPINLGRVYRIVSPAGKLGPKPNLAQTPSPELVNALASANGWTRDTAQRLLVERADPSAIPALKKLAVSTSSPLGQIHALWTLDGMGRPDKEAVLAALASPDATVRYTAIRVSEPLLATAARPEILARFANLANDPDLNVRRQLAFSLGEARDLSADEVLASVLLKSNGNALIRDAVFTSLGNRELEFTERLAAQTDWRPQSPANDQVFGALARAVFNEGKPDRLNRLFELIARQNGEAAWRQLAMLDGIVGTPAVAARGGRAGGGAAAGRAGGGAAVPAALPNTTPAQQAAVTAMDAAVALAVTAANDARLALIVSSLAEPRNNAEIISKTEGLRTAEQALAAARATEFTKIQTGADPLTPEQVQALVGQGLRGGAAVGGGAVVAAAAGGGARGAAGGARRGGGAGANAKKFSAEPAALVMMRSNGSAEVRSRLDGLEALITWPGKPGAIAEEPVVPLTPEQQVRFQAGKQIYSTTCGACHQPDGNGRDGLAPPLLDSEWALGSEARTIRIALQGVRGSINVKGKNYQLEMPPLSILSDEQIASVVTYVRREWGHTASPVDAAKVASVRTETSSRSAAWTEAELLRVE